MGNKRKTKIEHEEDVERFARRLRELRVERGMTQADLARRAEVTTTYVSKLENAGAAPGIDLVEKLAAALGLGIADLLPSEAPADSSAVARAQAQELFAALLKTADQQTFALLNPLLALLVESAGKRS
jgi:transcriptional regulator with XRE-family HTH domain